VNCRAAAREGGLGRSVSEIISDLSIRYQYERRNAMRIYVFRLPRWLAALLLRFRGEA
jgi:hypothetical protein